MQTLTLMRIPSAHGRQVDALTLVPTWFWGRVFGQMNFRAAVVFSLHEAGYPADEWNWSTA